jgi:hypothetical protein
VSRFSNQIALPDSPARDTAPNSSAEAEPAYLLTSAEFETEFAAALEAVPLPEEAIEVATAPASTTDPPVVMQAPPVVSHACVVFGPEGSATPEMQPESLAPPNIFTATLRALTAPLRSELFRETLRLTPSWGGSMLVHMLLVLGLALYMHQELRSTAPRTLELTIHEATGAGAPEDLNEAELPPVQASLQPVVLAAESDSPVTEVGDFLANPDVPLAIDQESSAQDLLALLADPSQVATKGGSSRAITDKRGKGTVELLENETSFFGVKGQGKKFCFIVDNSKSMTGARFRTALAELTYAVEKLQADQVFYVCFFSDGAYPLFFPNVTKEMIPATNENKAKFREWLRLVDLGPATYGSAAMKIGLDLEPDIMFLLGDGDFQDDTVREVLKRATPKTKVHTIGLDIAPRSRADAGFAAIARAFYGTYRNIRVGK